MGRPGWVLLCTGLLGALTVLYWLLIKSDTCADATPEQVRAVSAFLALPLVFWSCEHIKVTGHCQHPAASLGCPLSCGRCDGNASDGATLASLSVDSIDTSCDDTRFHEAASEIQTVWADQRLPLKGSCMQAWCLLGKGGNKLVYHSPSSPLVLKVSRHVAHTTQSSDDAIHEAGMLKEICKLGMMAHRVPWTGEPFLTADGMSAVAQKAVHGTQFRVRDGASFFSLLSADIPHAVLRQAATDLLQWERFLGSQRLHLPDLQFLMSPYGAIWLIDVKAVIRVENIWADMIPPTSLLRPDFGVATAKSDNASRGVLLEYSLRRQRLSLLSFALAAALLESGNTAHGGRSVELLHKLLCEAAVCELGCSIMSVPLALRGDGSGKSGHGPSLGKQRNGSLMNEAIERALQCTQPHMCLHQ